jgi:hypothetical protein
MLMSRESCRKQSRVLLAWILAFIGIGAVAPEFAWAGVLRLPFVENLGQLPEAVRFHATTRAGRWFVTREGDLILSISDADGKVFRIRETISGASRGDARGSRPATARVGFRRGASSSSWVQAAPTFNVITLGEILPGVELALAVNDDSVEKRFVLQPGADPKGIHAKLDGVSGMRVGTGGELLLESPVGTLAMTRPVAYQTFSGERHAVEVEYALRDGGYGFRLGDYDRSSELVIDPELRVTYLGGSGQDFVLDMVQDASSGDVYVTGSTTSLLFDTPDPEEPDTDAFVARLSGDLQTLYAIEFLGGTRADTGQQLALTPDGASLYLIGSTKSDDFPASIDAPQSAPPNTSLVDDDLFLARLDALTLGVDRATYVGGFAKERFGTLAVHSVSGHPNAGQVYIACESNSADFPATTGGAQESNAGLFDIVVARYSADLTSLIQSSYLGGSAGSETDPVIGIHPTSGDLVVAGITNATNFPATPNAADTTFGGFPTDMFVAEFGANLTTVVASFLGGDDLEETEQAEILFRASTGEAYVAGTTESTNFPTPSSGGGSRDAFVARAAVGLGAIEVARIGGMAGDLSRDIRVHPTTAKVYMVGTTGSTDLPGTSGGVQEAFTGIIGDAFVARFSADLATLEQSTYLGGSDSESSPSIALDPANGWVFVAGSTGSVDFPGVSGGFQTTIAGPVIHPRDAFIARLDESLQEPALLRSTYLGGSEPDATSHLLFDPVADMVLLAGVTTSPDLPATSTGAQSGFGGGLGDAFLAQVPSPLPEPSQSLLVGAAALATLAALRRRAVRCGALQQTDPVLRR